LIDRRGGISMKRILVVFLVILLLGGILAGCGGGSGQSAPASQPSPDTAGQTAGSEKAEYVFGQYSPENPLKIKLSHFAVTETNQLHRLAASFKEKIEKSTGGAVEVTIYTGGLLGNDVESLDSVIAGTLDMAVNNTPIMSNRYEAFQVLDIPYLFEDYDHIYAFLESDVCQQMMEDFGRKTGARMLCMQAVGYRNFDLKKPVKTPADLAGLKIRVTNSPVYLAQYEAWGANPLIIAGPEVITALQQGTIDGCDNVHNVAYSDGYYEYVDHITISEHAVHFNGLTIHNKLYESLVPELQELISNAAKEAAVERTRALRQENEEQLQLMVQAGAKVNTDIDKAAFKEAAKSVYEDFRAKNEGAKYLDAIIALANK